MRKSLFIIIFFILFSSIITPVSAFTMDSVIVQIDYDGTGIVDFHYSLNWYETMYYKWLAFISGGEEAFIETEFSKNLGKNVIVQNLDTTHNFASLYVPDIIDQRFDVDNDKLNGYWISLEGIKPKEPLKIDNVLIVYPDNFVQAQNGYIPSGLHFVNIELSAYYYYSQHHQHFYQKSSEMYDPSSHLWDNVLNTGGTFIGDIELFNSILTFGATDIAYTGLPSKVQNFIEAISSINELKNGGPYKKIIGNTEAIERVASDSSFTTRMGPGSPWKDTNKQIAADMVALSSLKKEEGKLLQKITSEPGEKGQFKEDYCNSLISNLNDQKTALIRLNKNSKEMVSKATILKEDYLNVGTTDETGSYLISVYELSEEASNIDLKHVEEELAYLDSLIESNNN
jgi:hypothetical protein